MKRKTNKQMEIHSWNYRVKHLLHQDSNELHEAFHIQELKENHNRRIWRIKHLEITSWSATL